MSDKKNIKLKGRLGKNPLVYFADGPAPMTAFPLAVNSASKSVQWHKIIAYGKLSEICAEKLKKGQLVSVEGHSRKRSWRGRDGKKRYVIEIIINKICRSGEKLA